MAIIFANNLKGVTGKMAAKRRKIRNLRGPNFRAARAIQLWTERDILASGRLHKAHSWPKLNPATIKRKGRSTPMLETGRLIDSFNATATMQFGKVTNTARARGRKRQRYPYARAHEFGTPKVPQRKLFPSEEQGADIVFSIYQKHVRIAIR